MKHLISIDDLANDEVAAILERAKHHIAINNQKNKSQQTLLGRTLINLFVETSTRTLTSFELAAKRLCADVITMNVEKSSITVKGETLADTAMTLNAMQPDFIVIRHNQSGQVKELAEHMDCSVINAGDGTNEHPTQALVDLATITHEFGSLAGLNIAICGDIVHSRVARSNIKLLRRFGANVRIIGPQAFLPQDLEVPAFTSLAEGLADVDVVMLLRVQTERMQASEIPSAQGYFVEYGLTLEKLKLAKPHAKVLHPGPINRGVEIADEVADHPEKSLILEQVHNGVSVRQSLLEFLAE